MLFREGALAGAQCGAESAGAPRALARGVGEAPDGIMGERVLPHSDSGPWEFLEPHPAPLVSR